MTTTDLIIVGAGPGGYRAAEYAAKQGLKVVIFEDSNVGGTCLNIGCIPTKTYVHSSSLAEARERMSQVVSQLRVGVETILSHPNITLVRERAIFENHGEGPVIIAGEEQYNAPKIIIATGSETKWLPLQDIHTDSRVVDSTGLLDIETLPKRLAIIGAGVIGMEFASVFHRFGSEVTVIEYLKECLPSLDCDIAKRLRKSLERQGVSFKMKTAVQSLSDVDADVILMATGRKPHIQADFAKAGIEFDEQKGVKVDENFQTNIKGIYAIGDVNGCQMLAHAAEMQAVRVINHIMGKEDGIRFDIMPAAIFTTPEAACVGPTEEQLKVQGIPYACKKSFWRANGKAMAMDQTEGMLKLFVSSIDGLLLGCHAFGAHASDIVQEVSALMCRDTTLNQLHDIIHMHPTLGEVLKAATE